jgi:hypothetical protein
MTRKREIEIEMECKGLEAERREMLKNEEWLMEHGI